MKDSDPYIVRALDLAALVQRKSHFLFGPRQTGKSSLVQHTLGKARVYNLLDTDVFLALSQRLKSRPRPTSGLPT